YVSVRRRRPPCCTRFPYTTLFRSEPVARHRVAAHDQVADQDLARARVVVARGVDGGRDLRVGERGHDLRPPVTVAQIAAAVDARSEEHTSELQSRSDLVCRLLLEK